MRKSWLLLLSAALLIPGFSRSAQARTKDRCTSNGAVGTSSVPRPMSSVSILINRPIEVVYDVIRDQRDSKILHKKLIGQEGKTFHIRENLSGIFWYGTVENYWDEVEVSPHRINILLARSDHFVSASGAWVLTPQPDGKSTILALECSLDAGLEIPFKDRITLCQLKKDSTRRLAGIKKQCEEGAL